MRFSRNPKIYFRSRLCGGSSLHHFFHLEQIDKGFMWNCHCFCIIQKPVHSITPTGIAFVYRHRNGCGIQKPVMFCRGVMGSFTHQRFPKQSFHLLTRLASTCTDWAMYTVGRFSCSIIYPSVERDFCFIKMHLDLKCSGNVVFPDRRSQNVRREAVKK